MAPAAVGERELVQPVVEALAIDDDVEIVGDGEVRQPKPAWRMFLREVDLAFGTVHGPPLPQPTLQGAKHALVIVAGMTTLQLFEQRHRVEFGVDLQQRNDFGVPDIGQRIVARSPAPLRPL